MAINFSYSTSTAEVTIKDEETGNVICLSRGESMWLAQRILKSFDFELI